jgi:hypothetical protein
MLHDAAGRLLVVAHQVANVGRKSRRDRLQQPFDLLARQLRQQVGGVVGLERGQERAQSRLGQAIEQGVAGLVAEQAEHRRGLWRCEVGEQAGPEIVLLDRVEQLGRVRRIRGGASRPARSLAAHLREHDS